MDPMDDRRELREYLQVLKRRKVLVIVVALIPMAGAFAFSMAQTPTYKATAELLFESGRARYIVDPNSQRIGDPQRLLENEVQFVESDRVADAAEAKIGVRGEVEVAVSQPTGDIMFVTAEADNGPDAAAIANSTAEAYIEERREQGVEDYRHTIEVTQANLDEVQRAQFEAALRIGELNAELGSPTPQSDISTLTAERNSLQANQSTLFDQAIRLQGDLRDLNLGFDLAETDVATLTRPALVPSVPASPKPLRSAAVGLVAGLILGVGVAFVRDYLDDRVKTRDRLEVFLRGRLPVLAAVPGGDDDRDVGVVSIDDPRAPASEAYRTLRTSLSFVSVDDPPQVIQVTSGEPEAGKTTTAANLAVATARAGHTVLLVDADLRRSRLHELLGMASRPGLLDAVRNGSLDGVIQSADGVDRLDLLSSGGLAPDPSALVGSDRFAQLFTAIRQRYDVVVLDSPPVLPVADSIALTRVADAVIVVVDADRTTTRELGKTLEAIDQVDATVAGVVLNRSREQAAYYEPYLAPDGTRRQSRRRSRPLRSTPPPTSRRPSP